MEDKILDFQFELVSTKSTHSSYNDGSDGDEPQKQPPEVFCKKGALRNFAKNFIYKKYLGDCFWNQKLNIKD